MTRLDKIPLAKSPVLKPSHAYYIQGAAALTDGAGTRVTDISNGQTPPSEFVVAGGPATTGLLPGVLVSRAKADAGAARPFVQLTKPSILSTALSAADADGKAVATISGSTLTLGRHTITFSGSSSLLPAAPDNDNDDATTAGAVQQQPPYHPVTLGPVAHMSRADEFVVDSVPFLWDVVDGTRRCELSKVLGGRRVEIGRFVAEGTRDKTGVLVVDGEQVDVLVAVLTCVAVLNRMDSFRF